MTKDHILSSPPSQSAHDPGLELGTADEHLFLIGGKPGETLCLTPGDQGDLLHRIMVSH